MILRKITIWLLKLAWQLFALFMVLVVGVVSIGREFTPRLPEYKSSIEQYLTRSLGARVTIGEISGYWQGVDPVLTLQNFTLQQDVTQISLDRLSVEIDLIGSMLHISPRVFYITSDNLDAVIPAELLHGLFSAHKDQGDAGMLDALVAAQRVDIGKVDIRARDIQGNNRPLLTGALHTERDEDFHRIRLSGSLFGRQLFSLLFEGSGDPLDIWRVNGAAYIELQKIALDSAVVERFGEAWPDTALSGVSANGRFWLNFDAGNISVNGDAALKLEFEKIQRSLSVKSNITGTATVQQWKLDFPELRSSLLAEQVLQASIEGSTESFQHGIELRIAQLPLSTITDQLLAFPSPVLAKTLGVLKPSGNLARVLIHLPVPSKNSAVENVDSASEKVTAPFSIRAELDNVGLSPWEGAPGLAHVNGYLSTSLHDGYVTLASESGFSMSFPGIYQNPLVYEKAHATVQWQIDTDRIQVGSPQILLQGEEGKPVAALYLSLPTHHAAHDVKPDVTTDSYPEMYLMVGLQDTDAKYREKLLPSILPASLLNWLHVSIKAGHLEQTGFIYRGSISPGDERRTTQYFGSFDHTTLDYSPPWPALSEIAGYVVVDNDVVHAETDQAKIMNSAVTTATVDVTHEQQGKVSDIMLRVKGGVVGPANDGLNILRNPPLRGSVGATFDHWSAEGGCTATLDLLVPLEGRLRGTQTVAINFKQNILRLLDINIDLTRIDGALNFSTDRGLVANQLRAMWLDQPLDVSLQSTVKADTLTAVRVGFSGKADPVRLAAWTQNPLLRFIEGSFPFTGGIDIFTDGSGKANQLQVESQLVGASINLPDGLGKLPTEKKPMALRIGFLAEGQRYSIDYGADVHADLLHSNNGSTTGEVEVRTGEADYRHHTNGIRVSGRLHHVEPAPFTEIVQRYATYAALYDTNPSSAAAATAQYPVFHFDIDKAVIGSYVFPAVEATIAYANQRWSAQLRSSELAGVVGIAPGDHVVPDIQLDYLKLSFADTQPDVNAAKPAAALANVNPADFPELKMSVQSLWLNNRDYGQWRFELQPIPGGAKFANVFGQLNDIYISGDHKRFENPRYGAELSWVINNGQHTTQLTAATYVRNERSIAELFNIEPMIKSKSSAIYGKVSWPASPDNFDLVSATGDIVAWSKDGQFLKSSTSTNVMRVLSVFNMNAWARRLKLDFSDLYKQGVSYDKMKTTINIQDGVLTLVEPVVVQSPASNFELSGLIYLKDETLDTKLAVTLPVTSNAAWIVALAGGLPAAAGVYVVSKIFEKQLDNFSSLTYQVTGPLADPNIQFDHVLKTSVLPRKKIETGDDN